MGFGGWGMKKARCLIRPRVRNPPATALPFKSEILNSSSNPKPFPHSHSPIPHTPSPIPLLSLLLLTPIKHKLPSDNDRDGTRGRVEWSAAPDDHVGLLACFEGADPVGDAED